MVDIMVGSFFISKADAGPYMQGTCLTPLL